MKNLYFTVALFVMFASTPSIGQVGIGTTTPNAQLEIQSSNQAAPLNTDGIIIPKVDDFPTTNPAVAQQGMLIYLNIATTFLATVRQPGFYYWNNPTSDWIGISSTSNGDHDWYEEGTTVAPDAITDDMFHTGNVAIGKNTADYPLEVNTTNFNKGILNTFASTTTDGTDKSALENDLSISGNDKIFGTKTSISGAGNGEFYGNHAYINGSGVGNHFGSFNELMSTGIGLQYGTYNQLNNNGDGNHLGLANAMGGTGNGTHWGVSNNLESSGSGDHTGIYNNISGSGTGLQYGAHNWISNSGLGTHYGTLNNLTGAGVGLQYGTYNAIVNSGTSAHYAVFNALGSTGSGLQYGNYTTITNSGPGNHYGNYATIANAGTGNHYGNYNLLSGTGVGQQYGTVNEINNVGGTTHYGEDTTLSGVGAGAQIGNNITITNTGGNSHTGVAVALTASSPTGTKSGFSATIVNNGNASGAGLTTTISGSSSGGNTGLFNSITTTGAGNVFGVNNAIQGTGTGVKYGFYNLIDPASGGTHYGVHSTFLKAGATNFAGYFLGNVGIGTTTANTYTLPPSRGTNLQIMQTNATGIVSWQNASAIQDHDWYEVGGILAPDAITDNIFHTGTVSIGKITAGFPLDVISNTRTINSVSTTGTTAAIFGVNTTAVGAGAGGHGIAGQTNQSGSSGVRGEQINAAGLGVSGINFAAAGASTGIGIFGQTSQAEGFGNSSYNLNTSGTGAFSVGNNVLGQYLVSGSGGAFNGYTTALYARATTPGVGESVYTDNFGAIVRVNYWNGTQYKIIGAGTVSTTAEGLNSERVTLHCTEAPEILFEDYGEGQLINGRTHIKIDPIIAKNITVNEKHPLRVFIQLEGECNGVYVTNKTGNSFDVVELASGISNAKFQYRIVGNRADEVLPNGRISKNADIRFEVAPKELSTVPATRVETGNPTASTEK